MCYCRPVTVFLIAIGQSNLIIQKMGVTLAERFPFGDGVDRRKFFEFCLVPSVFCVERPRHSSLSSFHGSMLNRNQPIAAICNQRQLRRALG
jgi:hypothetical protein